MGQILSSILRFLCCDYYYSKPPISQPSIDFHHIQLRVDDDPVPAQGHRQQENDVQEALVEESCYVDIDIITPHPPDEDADAVLSNNHNNKTSVAPSHDAPLSSSNTTTVINKSYKDAVTSNVITTSETETETQVIAVKRIGPYLSSHNILLVGEGDFSFSACLALAFGSASNMLATSLNSKDFLSKNYANFSSNKHNLVTRGCIVLHGIDATEMATHAKLSSLKFDRIVFNFPHAGFRSKETPNIELGRHQKLVSGFLRNAKTMIEEDGQIHIRHKSNDAFLKWNIPKLASDQGLLLISESKFKQSKFPGYHTKYGFGGDKDFDCHPSKTYMFALAS